MDTGRIDGLHGNRKPCYLVKMIIVAPHYNQHRISYQTLRFKRVSKKRHDPGFSEKDLSEEHVPQENDLSGEEHLYKI